MRERVEQVVREHSNGTVIVEAGKEKLFDTRRAVLRGWKVVISSLSHIGEYQLANKVNRFIDQMSPPPTEKGRLAVELYDRLRERATAKQR